MANFIKCGDNIKISIPKWEDVDKCTFYEIHIEIGDTFWTISRRYSEFSKLHEHLVAEHGVTSDILPPKKVIGNRDEAFIEKRRRALEIYLSTIVRFLQKTMPKQLAVFLSLDKFDILYIIKDLAVYFFTNGAFLLSKGKENVFTPLQLYAINERFMLECSNLELVDKREDFSHVLDFCSQVSSVMVTGSDVRIPNSNIIPNELPISFAAFKNLTHLTLHLVDCSQILDLGSLRETLKELKAEGCSITSVRNLLLCDKTHQNTFDSKHSWVALKHITIRESHLTNIDQSVTLLPNTHSFVVEENRLERLDNLENMPSLRCINLRNNRINLYEGLELRASKLVLVDLSQNIVDKLQPFSKLFALETLNLQSNRVSDITEVRHVADLPCLENLVLTGNPVSIIIDYRIKVLEYFGKQVYRICLDNESTNQKELDKVAIFKALRASKQDVPYFST